MSFNKLYFNSVEIIQKGNSLSVNPNFLCPKCGVGKTVTENTLAAKSVASEPIATVDALSKPLAKLDFNRQVDFVLPCCGSKVSLFVAVHRDADGLRICVQRSDAEGAGGIPSDWWVREP